MGYILPDKKTWTGRETSFPSYIYQFINLLNLKECNSTLGSGVGFLGFECDIGVLRNHGRSGAAEGPRFLRESLGKLAYLRDDSLKLYDAGNITCLDQDLEKAQESFGEHVYQLLHANLHPILIGGGHEIAYGTYLGVKKKIKEEPLTIINFDAHYDLRLNTKGLGNSGTSFNQIASDRQKQKAPFHYVCFGIQPYGNTRELHSQAKELQVTTFLAEDFYFKPSDFFLKELKTIIDASTNIFISICLDVFNQAFAPGVSAPQSLGLTPWHVLPLLRLLAKSKKTIGIEIAELSPKNDQDQQTSRLAATLICDYIHQFNLD